MSCIALHRPQQNVHHSCSANAWAFHHVMELIEHSTDIVMRSFLASRYNPEKMDHHRQIQEIVDICMDNLLHLEGSRAPQQERKEGLKQPGRNKKTSVQAMGKRVRTHKKNTRQSLLCFKSEAESRGIDTCPLVAKCDWEAHDRMRKPAQPVELPIANEKRNTPPPNKISQPGGVTPPDNTSMLAFYGVARKQMYQQHQQQWEEENAPNETTVGPTGHAVI